METDSDGNFLFSNVVGANTFRIEIKIKELKILEPRTCLASPPEPPDLGWQDCLATSPDLEAQDFCLDYAIIIFSERKIASEWL